MRLIISKRAMHIGWVRFFKKATSSFDFQDITSSALFKNLTEGKKNPGDVPYVTWKFDGDFPKTQCVAVRTHSALINEPPQNCLPFPVRSNACQGQELMGASLPPTMSVEFVGRLPQIAAKKMH